MELTLQIILFGAFLLILAVMAVWLFLESRGKRGGPNRVASGPIHRSPPPPYPSASPDNAKITILVRELAAEMAAIESKLNIPAQQSYHAGNDAELKVLIGRVKSIGTAIDGLANPVADVHGRAGDEQDAAAAAPQEPVWSPRGAADGVPAEFEAGPSFSDELVRHFNEAQHNRILRGEFFERYQTVQIGNRNATDQMMDRAHSVDFRTVDNGDFIAVHNPADGRYLVVPYFNLTINDSNFRFGGIDHSFKCDFSPAIPYSGFSLAKPAEFSRSGDGWELREKGELSLLQG